MPGQGKYTSYYDHAFADNEEKKTRLELVYPRGVFTSGGPYNQTDVVQVGNDRLFAIGNPESGTEFLQKGDVNMYPNGVYLDFRGPVNNEDMADISTVKWAKAGDPLNAYVPDVRSPGPAPGTDLSSTSTAVVTVNADASEGDFRDESPDELAGIEAFNPNYDPAETDAEKFDNKGTRNPIHTGRKIHEVASVSVDKPLKLGDSMRNAGD